MDKICILDCTLRDGGRIIDCRFSDTQIQKITSNLALSNINIIELGFLTSSASTLMYPNSTYFQDIKDTKPYINANAQYSVFANFGQFNFNTLPPYIQGLAQIIRIGFTLEDFSTNLAQLKQVFLHVKSLGYKIFMQPLNTPAYSDDIFTNLLAFANEIQPDSFAIVDTFGSMFEEDLEHYFLLTQKFLLPQINLDFHSHNNLQLSFANAIWLTKQNLSERILIIDSTLHGLGRGGGNLNTELIAQYLNNKYATNYNIKNLIKTIDKEILPIKQSANWGYSIQAFLGGIYKIHPRNLEPFYKEYSSDKS